MSIVIDLDRDDERGGRVKGRRGDAEKGRRGEERWGDAEMGRMGDGERAGLVLRLCRPM